MNTSDNIAYTSHENTVPHLPRVRYIPLRLNPNQPRPTAGLDVVESDPRIWNLTWFNQPASPEQLMTILSKAEDAVLPLGGQFIRFRAPQDAAEITDRLKDYKATHPAPGHGQQWEMTLMLPDDDGLVHDDRDDRTPLNRITCPACVFNIAEQRRHRRDQASSEGPRGMAQHSRRVADAYARLSEVELAMTQRPISKPANQSYPAPDAELRQRINELADQWEDETGFMSNLGTAVRHEAYRAIVAMGNAAVRPLLERLEEKGGHWTIALREITGESPVPEEDKGKVLQIRMRWLDWGWQHGLLPSNETPGRTKTK